MEDGDEHRPAVTSAEQFVTARKIWDSLEQGKEEALPAITVGGPGQLRKAYANPEQSGTVRATLSNAGKSGDTWESLGLLGNAEGPETTRNNSEQRGVPGTARVNRSRQGQYGKVKESLGMLGICRYPRTS